MEKKVVFISHITEESELANEFKKLIETSFLGMIEVFVSSNEENIAMGQRWLDNITNSLNAASVEILLCSPNSVKRPWINFEAGAGWIRNIPVIPLCHSGMTPSKLPIPLNLLQAANMSEPSELRLIFPVLAQAIGSSVPAVDFTIFTDFVKEFEEKYTFWSECNKKFTDLNNFNSQIIPALRKGLRIDIDLQETDIRFFEELMKFFTPNDILAFTRIGSVKMTTGGTFYDCTLTPLSRLQDILNNKNFNY